MGRCRPFPDAAGCRWPRLNGKIYNFSLLDSNETLNFKFVYNKWKSTRCKKTLNKQTKTQRNKVTEKHVFYKRQKFIELFRYATSPQPPNGRVHGLGEEDLQTFQMPLWNVCICIDATTIPGNHYPPSLLQPTTRPDQRQYFPATIIALVQMLLLQPLRESSALSVGWFSVGLSTCLFSSMQKPSSFYKLYKQITKNWCLMKTKLKFWFQCSVNVTDYLGKSDAF